MENPEVVLVCITEAVVSRFRKLNAYWRFGWVAEAHR